MDPKQDRIIADILSRIESLPAEEQVEALLQLHAIALRVMSVQQIKAFRRDLSGATTRRAIGNEAVEELIEIIDGHLALRDIVSEE